MAAYAAVGQRSKRIDAPQKLTGQERFTADLRIPGMLYTRPVGSAYAHARIKNVDVAAALKVPGVVAVVTGDQLPEATRRALSSGRSPIAFGEALYAGQFVAMVLAETDAAAQDGAAAVEIDYEPMPVVATLEEAMSRNAPKVRLAAAHVNEAEAAMHNADAARPAAADDEPLPPNVSNSVHFQRGDVEQGFREAAATVEFSFESQTVHQGYMEPQVCLVTVDPLGDYTVYTSTQAAFYCRARVAEAVGVEPQKVDVVAMPVGGGFGGKFVLIEPLVAGLAQVTERPVLLQYSRMDDFLNGNPAPDCQMSIKLGADKDGTITALQARVSFDTGASSGSPLQIACVLLGGSYRFPNLDIRGFEALTNKPAAGAYRAPGAQQAAFGIESAMDELARKLELDPLEMRLRNCVVEGDPRPNGAAWPRVGVKDVLEALRDHPAWQGRDEARKQGRGVGVALGGWPGGVEPATAICRLDSNGKLSLILGSVDLTGTNSVFAQVAAETFGMEHSDFSVTTASTDSAPYAGGTGGSKITYTMSRAVQKAAESARQQILEAAGKHLEAAIDDLEIVDGNVRVKGVPGSGVTLKQIAQMSMSFGGRHEPIYGVGSTAITESAPGFAAHLCEVTVDELTGEVQPVRYVAVQDVGFAINPTLVEGQIHGGVGQGIGWALYEGMQYDNDGQLLSATLMDYTLPRFGMIPPIETVLVEVPSVHGAYGSKGVGEPPAIPGPAAVANAIRDLTGVRATQIPIRPQALAEAIWARGNG